MPIVTLKELINTINKSYIIKSTKLDSTIKAIINNFKVLNFSYSSTITKYLNILKVIYYLKRLKYYNNNKYLNTLGKYIHF